LDRKKEKETDKLRETRQGKGYFSLPDLRDCLADLSSIVCHSLADCLPFSCRLSSLLLQMQPEGQKIKIEGRSKWQEKRVGGDETQKERYS
jgi:hypothetical protein